MIRFVNAKINLGLKVIRRRSDGFHDLATIFYPVGLYNGTPQCPDHFCDILEISPGEKKLILEGECGSDLLLNPENNLVWRAALLLHETTGCELPFTLRLEKHIPSQAGLGGGSADAAFTLLMLNELCGSPLARPELSQLALKLGADCPFFLVNHPTFATGVGEILEEIQPRLSGYWIAIAKPDENISTAEAFRHITPCGCDCNLTDIYLGDIRLWRTALQNDFEASFFSLHPHCRQIKDSFYESGALYSSLSGSGSSFYGIFSTEKKARAALNRLHLPYKALALA